MIKNRIVAFILLALVAALAFSSIILRVSAVGVAITSITPATHDGPVGQTVEVVGTVNATNGSYEIFFGNQSMVNQTAKNNVVNATFQVPQTPQGNYTLTLKDVTKNINATSYFLVVPSYYIEVDKSMLSDSKQFQEGDNVTLMLNITGGYANKVYSANVTVEIPTSFSNQSSTLLSISTSDEGYGASSVLYPNASRFSGEPNTNYTGTYNVSFNNTLASNTFFIGLTNATQYHRFQTADIRAYGYKSSEPVNLRILSQGKLIRLINSTAGSSGVVDILWNVPSNASVGTYISNITSLSSSPTEKQPADVQAFIIPGFSVNVTCRNLAGDLVPSITLYVYENSKLSTTLTGGSDGVVPLKLETGNYTANAFFHLTLPVAQFPINVSGPFVFDMKCNLTNLRIHTVAIKNGSKIPIPNVVIYVTTDNSVHTTDANGTVIVHSLWAKYNYTLDAFRYNVQFNPKNNNTLTSLLINQNVSTWFNTTLVCPNLQLTLNVTDANSQPLKGIEVTAQESMGGLIYRTNTSSSGTAYFNCAFGEYVIRAYDAHGLELNETSVQLLNLTQPNATNATMKCLLYNLSVSIKITDFFGQPISNMNVTLQRQGLTPQSMMTKNNGTATFVGVTGGNMEASVYMNGGTIPYETTNFALTKSTLVEVRMNRFVFLAGALVDVAVFSIVIIIVATILVVLAVEIYRNRRARREEPKPDAK